MNSAQRHPSPYDLDRMALGAALGEDVFVHIRQCARCTKYLAQARSAGPTPGWVRELSSRRKRSGWPHTLAWAGGLGGAVAAASLLAAVFLGPLTRPQDTYTGAKGSPAVGVYIKRQTKVDLWNGKDPVYPGDVLRLKVAPDGLSHLVVYTIERGEHPRLVQLYSTRLKPAQTTLLPKAWKVDSNPGPETLVIALRASPLDQEAVQRALWNQSKTADLWVQRFDIPKDTSHGRRNEP